MRCPNCDATLLMTVRQEVEIDYCPECRGVWLDRGELDKIIQRSRAEEAAPPPPARADMRRRVDDSSDEYYRPDAYDPYGKPKRKPAAKRLGDLFDLF